MRTLVVYGGWVCTVAASVLSLSGCTVAAAGSEEGEEAVESTALALTSAQRSAAINAKANQNAASVGAPFGPFTNTAKPGGYRDYVNNASIYIGDAVGQAFIVRGLIRGKWDVFGAENSFLGFPITDEGTTAFGTGQYSLFQGGRVLWKGGAGAAFETHGCNDDIYGRHGWEWGLLGFPTSDEQQITNRRKNDFENGRIYTRLSDPGGCADISWPVLTKTLIPNQLAAQGWPRITRLKLVKNAFGAFLDIEGAGFTPGLLVDFFINSPEFHVPISGTSGTGAVVQANGTFKFLPGDGVGVHFKEQSIIKINNVITIQAIHQGTGQMAVSSVTRSDMGTNYTRPF